MIGGYTKSSHLALLAAMGLFGGVASAQAADLGGNCCADLEERVAELEATTARKGNRKVSLEVSGFVHQGIMWFDGVAANDATPSQLKESNTYVGINRPEAASRFRFVGKASINAKMNAGYLMEIQVNTSNSDSVTASNDDGSTATATSPTNTNTLAVRHTAWWIEHKDMGKVWVGQTSQATDAITEIQLSNTGHFAQQNATAGATMLAVSNTVGLANRNLFTFMGGSNTDSSQIGEGNRRNLVKYESPAISGFILSAAAGEDEFWDVALRYAGEFSGIKLAFGVGYESTTDGPTSGTGSERNCISGVPLGKSDAKCQQLGLSGSVMHVPTGIFLNGHYGWRHDDNATLALQDDTSTRWGLMAGIEQNWLGIGKTTVYGEYQNWEIGGTNSLNATAAVGAEMTMWGVGLNQSIDAAAMDLYVQYRSFQDMSTISTTGVTTSYGDIQLIMAGGMIKF